MIKEGSRELQQPKGREWRGKQGIGEGTGEQMMHHAIPRGTVVPRGTALCGATLRPPEVK